MDTGLTATIPSERLSCHFAVLACTWFDHILRLYHSILACFSFSPKNVTKHNYTNKHSLRKKMSLTIQLNVQNIIKQIKYYLH